MDKGSFLCCYIYYYDDYYSEECVRSSPSSLEQLSYLLLLRMKYIQYAYTSIYPAFI